MEQGIQGQGRIVTHTIYSAVPSPQPLEVLSDVFPVDGRVCVQKAKQLTTG
jgi:hypothetical protein